MSDKTHSPEKNPSAQQRLSAKQTPTLLAATQATDEVALQCAAIDPARLRPADVLRLQRVVGNQVVSRLIQAKLMVGPAGDAYEQEADRVAEQVVNSPLSMAKAQLPKASAQRQAEEEEVQTKAEDEVKPLAATITPLVRRRAEEEEEVQAKPLVQRAAPEEEELQTKAEDKAKVKPLVQRQAEEEEEIQTLPRAALQRQEAEEEVQMRSDLQPATSGFEAEATVADRIAATRGGGSPLPGEVRGYMEPRFGADFSGVRVHADAEAAQLNRSISAQAFTLGQDVYLGAGHYEPGTTAGKRLLAHELTHTIQQGASPVQKQDEEEEIQTEPLLQRQEEGVIQRATGLPDSAQLIELAGGKSFRFIKKPAYTSILDTLDRYKRLAEDDHDGKLLTLDSLQGYITAWFASSTRRAKKSTEKQHREDTRDRYLRELQEDVRKLREQVSIEKDINPHYKELVGHDLPKGLTVEQATARYRRYSLAQSDGGAGQHLLQLAHEIERQAPNPNMDSVFDLFVRCLRDSGFQYTSASTRAVMSDDLSRGCCQDLARVMSVVGMALGLVIDLAVVSETDFATPASQDLISTHMGNVKYEGEPSYTAKRFIFSAHVAVQSGGSWYDPTVPAMRGFGGPDTEIAWKLAPSGENRMNITEVRDGATFPDGTTRVAPETAYLEKEGGKTSEEFGAYWIVKKRG